MYTIVVPTLPVDATHLYVYADYETSQSTVRKSPFTTSLVRQTFRSPRYIFLLLGLLVSEEINA